MEYAILKGLAGFAVAIVVAALGQVLGMKFLWRLSVREKVIELDKKLSEISADMRAIRAELQLEFRNGLDSHMDKCQERVISRIAGTLEGLSNRLDGLADRPIRGVRRIA